MLKNLYLRISYQNIKKLAHQKIRAYLFNDMRVGSGTHYHSSDEKILCKEIFNRLLDPGAVAAVLTHI